MNTIFDEQGYLNISDIVRNHPSYKAIMEDGRVSDEELTGQAQAAIACLRKLQAICNEEQQAAIVDAITELGILFAAYHNYELKDICK